MSYTILTPQMVLRVYKELEERGERPSCPKVAEELKNQGIVRLRQVMLSADRRSATSYPRHPRVALTYKRRIAGVSLVCLVLIHSSSTMIPMIPSGCKAGASKRSSLPRMLSRRTRAW